MADLLYHYCAPSVFLSLIQRRELWLTSLTQSNDSAEGIWILDEWLGRFDTSKPEMRRQQLGAKFILEGALTNRLALGMCFSESDDLLSQWRGYAANGAGFAVGFDREGLRNLALTTSVGPKVTLEQMSYGARDFAAVNGAIANLNDTFGDDAKRVEFEDDGLAGVVLGYTPDEHEQQTDAVRQMFTVKNGAFHEEQEWRLLAVDLESKFTNLDFRERGGTIAPYARIKFPKNLIKYVRRGPTNPTPEAIVKLALQRHGIECSVGRSKATYR